MFWTRVRPPTSPPKVYWHESVKSRIVSDTQYTFYGDEFGFDRASNNLTATSEATDLISAKNVNANDDSFTPMAMAA